jgi:hypothetical protein
VIFLQIHAAGDTRATVTVGYMKDGEEGDSWTIELRTMPIGTYPDGKPKLGAYVVIVDPPARRAEAVSKPKKTKKLSDAAKIALQALAEALAEVGVAPPATAFIPKSVKTVVTAQQWRDYAYRRSISTGKDRARQSVFERAQRQLQARHHVGAWDDYIWLVPRTETGEQ